MKNLIKLCMYGVSILLMPSCVDSHDASSVSNKYNETISTILSRKSVRDYSDRKVSADTIEMLLRAAMSAPTAVNKQPWKFIVVTNEDKLKQMADSLPYAKMIKTAPLVVVVCGNAAKFLDGEAREFWVQDCSAATENMLLAAHSLGLGAVWTGAYPGMERVNMLRNILDLESNLIPLCAVPIGYPAENPEVKNKWKADNIIYVK